MCTVSGDTTNETEKRYVPRHRPPHHVEFHPSLGLRERELLLAYPQLILPQDLLVSKERDLTKPPKRSLGLDPVSASGKEVPSFNGRRSMNDRIQRGHKGNLTLPAFLSMSDFYNLQVMHNAERSRGNQTAAKPSGADRRRYQPNPLGAPSWQSRPNARTVYGTAAHTKSAPANSLQRVTRFVTAGLTVPCISRAIRREVLFAKRQNKGHHSRKRKSSFSHIGC